MRDEALAALGAGRCNRALASVSLAGCAAITDAGVATLTLGCGGGGRGGGGLKYLSLSNCPNLTDAGLSYIALRCPGLEFLAVEHNVCVTDVGVRALCATATSLATLQLRGCEGVTYGALAAFAAARPLTAADARNRCVASILSGPALRVREGFLALCSRQTAATVMVQRRWRRITGRRAAIAAGEAALLAFREARRRASTCIQRHVRGRTARLRYARTCAARRRAAVCIQRHARGRAARTRVRAIRRDNARRRLAGVRVLATLRARVDAVRRRIETRRAVARLRVARCLQRRWRGAVGRRRAAAWRAAATRGARTIQRVYRGHRGRVRAAAARAAGTRLALHCQRYYRGRRGREVARHARADRAARLAAATKIQRWRREVLLRRAIRDIRARAHAARLAAMREGATGLQRLWRGVLGRRRARLVSRARTHTDLRHHSSRVIARGWRDYRVRVRVETTRLLRIRVWTKEHDVRVRAFRRQRLREEGSAARLQVWWGKLRRAWASRARAVWAAEYVARFGQTHARRRTAAAAVADRRLRYNVAAREMQRIWLRHHRVTAWRVAAAGAVRDARAEAYSQWGMWYERRDAFNTFTPQSRAASYIQGAWRRHAEYVEVTAAVEAALVAERNARRPSEIARRAAAAAEAAAKAAAAEAGAKAATDAGSGGEGASARPASAVAAAPETLVGATLSIVPRRVHALSSGTAQSAGIAPSTPSPARARGVTAAAAGSGGGAGGGSTALVLMSAADAGATPGSADTAAAATAAAAASAAAASAPNRGAAAATRQRFEVRLPRRRLYERAPPSPRRFCGLATLEAEPLDVAAEGVAEVRVTIGAIDTATFRELQAQCRGRGEACFTQVATDMSEPLSDGVRAICDAELRHDVRGNLREDGLSEAQIVAAVEAWELARAPSKRAQHVYLWKRMGPIATAAARISSVEVAPGPRLEAADLDDACTLELRTTCQDTAALRLVNIAVAPASAAASDFSAALAQAGYVRVGADLGDCGLASGLQVWARYARLSLGPVIEPARPPHYTEELQVRVRYICVPTRLPQQQLVLVLLQRSGSCLLLLLVLPLPPHRSGCVGPGIFSQVLLARECTQSVSHTRVCCSESRPPWRSLMRTWQSCLNSTASCAGAKPSQQLTT